MMKVNPLVLLFLVSVGLNGLFGYLSYKFHSEGETTKVALSSCQETNTYLGRSIEKQKKEADVHDMVVSEFQQKQQEIHKQQCKIVEQITLLPKSTTQGKQNDEIDIDSKLPITIIGLLRESHYSLQGTSGSNASESFD